MKTQITPTISVEFDPAEQETADWIAGAAREALALIETQWGFPAPADCRFFLMTDPVRFFFRSAPWTWKVMLAVGFPLWYGRAKRTWPFSAAWTQRYGRRTAIGIKPPRLWETSDRTIGKMIYVEEKDTRRKVRHLTCHELVHACSAQLVLPAWMNEGIATLTVEKFMQAPVFRDDTIEIVRTTQPKGPPSSYRQMARQSKEDIAYQAVRGYWLVRYLEETRPGFLARIIAARREILAFDEKAAQELGMDPARFWEEIDGVLVEYFAVIRSNA
jgi:hypothetical protein